MLVLAYGVSETRAPQIEWPGILRQQTVADYLGKHFSHKPERYGESLVAAAYQIPAELDLNRITEDLDKTGHRVIVWAETGS